MDMKTIELLEDLVTLMSFGTISCWEKAAYKDRIRKLLDELA